MFDAGVAVAGFLAWAGVAAVVLKIISHGGRWPARGLGCSTDGTLGKADGVEGVRWSSSSDVAISIAVFGTERRSSALGVAALSPKRSTSVLLAWETPGCRAG